MKYTDTQLYNMEINNGDPAQRNDGQGNSKKILFIIAIYLLLTLSSKFTQQKDKSYEELIQNIKSQSKGFGLDMMMKVFQNDQIYEGRWSRSKESGIQYGFLSESDGKFQIRMTTSMSPQYTTVYKVKLSFLNGDYIDKGVLEYIFQLNAADWVSQKIGSHSVLLFMKKEMGLDAAFSEQEIIRTLNQGSANITNLEFTFTVNDDDSLKIELDLQCMEMSQRLTFGGQEHKILKMMIFAGVMFLISYLPFSAIMKILRDIYEQRDRASSYSLATLTAATMWDAVLCMVSFVYAFKDQESLILFIMPAFLLCLLFTNLQLRLMMHVYQSLTVPGDFRRTICKFNLLSYGSLLLIYPILHFTNFNSIFFLVISCIAFPQIYVNGQTGNRPDPNNAYYTRFLLVRFSIIFYLRCFPLNAFGLKPDYVLSFCCFCLIAFQFTLLHIQKIYGSKKVIPAFMLELVYNYKFEEEINIEEGVDFKECVICLNPLHFGPAHGELEQKTVNFKLMSTPCHHVYHSDCLIQWMKIKMECPQCRNKLPPFQ